jgi:hypothetical protein
MPAGLVGLQVARAGAARDRRRPRMAPFSPPCARCIPDHPSKPSRHMRLIAQSTPRRNAAERIRRLDRFDRVGTSAGVKELLAGGGAGDRERLPIPGSEVESVLFTCRLPAMEWLPAHLLIEAGTLHQSRRSGSEKGPSSAKHPAALHVDRFPPRSIARIFWSRAVSQRDALVRSVEASERSARCPSATYEAASR